MTVNTKTVSNRRNLRFSTLDEAVEDARKLVEAPRVRMLGNWQLDNLLMHLAFTVNHAIDGFPPHMRVPFFLRWILPWFKGMAMKQMTPGIKLPAAREAEVFPHVPSNRDAFDQFAKAVARTKSERMTSDHPAFGKMTHDDWVQMNLRHCELHLSFALPD